jgi:hypothetical protein
MILSYLMFTINDYQGCPVFCLSKSMKNVFDYR